MALSADAMATMIETAQPTSPAALFAVVAQYVMANATITSIGVSATISITGALGPEWDGDPTNDAQACVSGISSGNIITVVMPSPAPPQTDTWTCGNASTIDIQYNLSNHQYVSNFCQAIIDGITSGSGTGPAISIQ